MNNMLQWKVIKPHDLMGHHNYDIIIMVAKQQGVFAPMWKCVGTHLHSI